MENTNSPVLTAKMFDAKAGCGGCLVLFIAFFVFIFWGMPYLLGSYAEHTAKTPGDPKNYRPLEQLAAVTAYAGDGALLQEVSIRYIRKDGTVNLEADSYAPSVEYSFIRKLAEPPKDAPPVGAGTSVKGEWVEPIDIEVIKPGGRRYVRRTSGGTSTSYSYIHHGMLRETSKATQVENPQAIALPSCSLSELWDKAVDNNASLNDAVANIEIKEDDLIFTISGAGIYRSFTKDCEVVR